MSEPKRSSRYRRAEIPDELVLQPRDVRILLTIYAYGFLSRSQLQRLHFSGLYRACRRLRKLYDHAYLDRLWVPRTALGLPDPVDQPLAITGSPPALYRLGPAGVPLVARHLEEDLDLVRKRAKLAPKPSILAHDYLLNELRVQLELQVASHPELALERWVSGPDCFARYEHLDPTLNDRAVTRVFNPDGFFRLHRGEGVHAAFVEIDLGTESVQRRFRDKIQTYRNYVRSGQFLERFGQRRFRVLTVTTSEQRIRNLARIAEEHNAGQAFWFTTRDELLAGADFLADAVWRRAPGLERERFLE